MGKSLLEHMRTIPDYRCNREKPHDHAEMLTYLVAGYLNGRVSVGRAICWCEDNIEMLKKHMTLKQGIASEATISRILNGIDSYMFMYAFMEWTAEILYEHDIHIIIDGKALRGAAEKIKNGDTYDEKLGALYHGWDPNRREDLHTSGHATADDIRRMILTVKPQEYIVPIHTEKPEMFEKLDIGVYLNRIRLFDGKSVDV